MTCGSIAASTLVNATGDLVVEGLTTLKGNVTIGNAVTDTIGFFGATPVAGNASGAHLVGHINYRPSGLVLRGTSTADIGVTVASFTDSLVTLIVKKSY